MQGSKEAQNDVTKFDPIFFLSYEKTCHGTYFYPASSIFDICRHSRDMLKNHVFAYGDFNAEKQETNKSPWNLDICAIQICTFCILLLPYHPSQNISSSLICEELKVSWSDAQYTMLLYGSRLHLLATPHCQLGGAPGRPPRGTVLAPFHSTHSIKHSTCDCLNIWSTET